MAGADVTSAAARVHCPSSEAVVINIRETSVAAAWLEREFVAAWSSRKHFSTRSAGTPRCSRSFSTAGRYSVRIRTGTVFPPGRVSGKRHGHQVVTRRGRRRHGSVLRAGEQLLEVALRSFSIADELTQRQVRLNLGGSVCDPTDPVGRLLFNVLAMVAEFETDLIRLRTREGMKLARAKGRLRGKQFKLNHRQEAHLVALFDSGDHSTAELAELFGVTRSTVYRAVERERTRAGGEASAIAS